MSSPASKSIPVTLSLPDSVLGQLSQIKAAKKLTDDEFASICVIFCLRLALDTSVELGRDTSLATDLHRAVLDVRGLQARIYDIIAGVEKSLADSRTHNAALTSLRRP